MLQDLYKTGNNQYVTRSELELLIQELQKLSRGAPGKDAIITPSTIKQIADMVKPIKGVDYHDGKPGYDGKTIIKEKEISGEELIRRITTSDTKLRIPFSSLEDGNILLGKLNDVVEHHNDLSQFATNYYDEYIQLRDKIQAIDIQFQQSGGIGLEEVQALLPTSQCNPADPTISDVANDTSVWQNTTTGMVWMMVCGNWVQITYDDCEVIRTEQDCDCVCPIEEPEYVSESGDNILAENGDVLDTEQNNL